MDERWNLKAEARAGAKKQRKAYPAVVQTINRQNQFFFEPRCKPSIPELRSVVVAKNDGRDQICCISCCVIATIASSIMATLRLAGINNYYIT